MTVHRQPGQAFPQEKTIALSTKTKRFTDQLTKANSSDLFRFRLNNRSRLNLTLRNVQGNALVQVLDSNRKVIPTSIRTRQRELSAQRTLDRGSYYLRVVPNNRNRTVTSGIIRYVLQASIQRSSTPSVQAADNLFVASTEPTSRRFNIELDYRFDTTGWFTPERRAVLEAAATAWENIILDEFPNTPRGKRTPYVINPATGGFVGANSEFVTDRPIDDLLIFVGARQLDGAILGLGGPSGSFTDERRYVGSNYEPWLGSIAFNASTNWFFDRTPTSSNDIPSGRQDFLSTAIHEIGHVLGFNASVEAFKSQVSSNLFNGPNAVSRNGGTGIPLDSSGSHIREGHEFGGSGEMLMDPNTAPGSRQLPTILDIAVLDDIGYTVNYNFASRNLPNRDTDTDSDRSRSSSGGASLPSPLPMRCGCAGCLMTSAKAISAKAISAKAMTLTKTSPVKGTRAKMTRAKMTQARQAFTASNASELMQKVLS